MITRIALALLLPLAACDAPPRPPVAGPEARKAVDAATEAYADCITDGAARAAPGEVPGTVIDRVVKSCAPARQTLAEKIVAFHRIGNPSYSQEQLDVVAEASIQQIEPQMKADGVGAYVTRSAPNQKAE